MDSPYAPPSTSPESPPPRPAVSSSRLPKPTVISVMGIIYLLGSCGGMLWALLSLIKLTIGSVIPEPHPAAPTIPGWAEFLEGGFTIAVCCLMFIAGLKLAKGRHDALRASNRYLITLVIGKLASIPLMVAYPPPSTSATVQSAIDNPLMTTMANAFVALLISLIFPAICVLVLNRQNVKNWLIVRGT